MSIASGVRGTTPPAGRACLFIAAALWCTSTAAEPGRFLGRVVVELVDDIEFDHKLRLAEDFGFEDPAGRVWLARKGEVLDGSSAPPEVRPFSPFGESLRKAFVVHDYFTRAKTEPWREIHRMFYHANLAEGVSQPQAKVLHMALRAGGWRWEVRGTSCYRTCHQGAPVLAWKPVTDDVDLRPLVDWIWQSNPSLDEIEARVDAVIRKPGPHIFGQTR
jgi:hypothetical protein